MQEVHDQITNWDGGDPLAEARDDCGLGGAESVPDGNCTVDQYKNWVLGECMDMANAFMDLLIPQEAPATTMRVLRWPNIYFTEDWPVWVNGTRGSMNSNSLGVAGYCRGSGQAFFFTTIGNPDTFEHEMGHSQHLAHFASGGETNFCWKHHSHTYPACLMGYNSGNFTVPLPAAATGSAIQIDTDGAGNRQWLCAKCHLKIRGWNDIKVPCNWEHPDVF